MVNFDPAGRHLLRETQVEGVDEQRLLPSAMDVTDFTQKRDETSHFWSCNHQPFLFGAKKTIPKG